jgi:hypothetical protein
LRENRFLLFGSGATAKNTRHRLFISRRLSWGGKRFPHSPSKPLLIKESYHLIILLSSKNSNLGSGMRFLKKKISKSLKNIDTTVFL